MASLLVKKRTSSRLSLSVSKALNCAASRKSNIRCNASICTAFSSNMARCSNSSIRISVGRKPSDSLSLALTVLNARDVG